MRSKGPSPRLPQMIHLFLVLSLCLNIYFLLSFGFKTGGEQVLSLQELGEIREPGTYGPSDLEVVDGSLTISAAGVKLQNTRVKGDLIIAEGVGEGCADICKVTVEDRALVQGGGENTVVFEDAMINHLVIDKEEGKVRVVLKGSTVVEKLTILGQACLSAVELSAAGSVKEISIETGEETELEGDFDAVFVAASEARVIFLDGQIKNLRSGKEARDAVITLKEGVVVETLEPGAPLEVAGAGAVKEVKVTAPGLCKLSGSVEKVTAGGRGIFLEFGRGRTETLLVQASAGTVMIHLAPGAKLGYLELNGAAGITGGGAVERVRINVSGVTIDESPGSVELGEGIKAEVAGKEIAAEKKPEPAPAPVKPAPTPAPAKPVAPVNPVKEFKVGDLTPGKKVVTVKLIYSDPQNYRVTVGKTPLNYYPDLKGFGGEVPEIDAKIGSVKVAKK